MLICKVMKKEHLKKFELKKYLTVISDGKISRKMKKCELDVSDSISNELDRNITEENTSSNEQKKTNEFDKISLPLSTLKLDEEDLSQSTGCTVLSEVEADNVKARVHFHANLVTETRERPRTCQEDLRILYYTDEEFEEFWNDYENEDDEEEILENVADDIENEVECTLFNSMI